MPREIYSYQGHAGACEVAGTSTILKDWRKQREQLAGVVGPAKGLGGRLVEWAQKKR